MCATIHGSLCVCERERHRDSGARILCIPGCIQLILLHLVPKCLGYRPSYRFHLRLLVPSVSPICCTKHVEHSECTFIFNMQAISVYIASPVFWAGGNGAKLCYLSWSLNLDDLRILCCWAIGRHHYIKLVLYSFPEHQVNCLDVVFN